MEVPVVTHASKIQCIQENTALSLNVSYKTVKLCVSPPSNCLLMCLWFVKNSNNDIFVTNILYN